MHGLQNCACLNLCLIECTAGLLQVHVPAGSLSPEFDPGFANEAETMFAFGQDPSSLANSVDQLQRRLRLSDVGLEQSLATQMRLEDATTIKVCARYDA